MSVLSTERLETLPSEPNPLFRMKNGSALPLNPHLYPSSYERPFEGVPEPGSGDAEDQECGETESSDDSEDDHLCSPEADLYHPEWFNEQEQRIRRLGALMDADHSFETTALRITTRVDYSYWRSKLSRDPPMRALWDRSKQTFFSKWTFYGLIQYCLRFINGCFGGYNPWSAYLTESDQAYAYMGALNSAVKYLHEWFYENEAMFPTARFENLDRRRVPLFLLYVHTTFPKFLQDLLGLDRHWDLRGEEIRELEINASGESELHLAVASANVEKVQDLAFDELLREWTTKAGYTALDYVNFALDPARRVECYDDTWTAELWKPTFLFHPGMQWAEEWWEYCTETGRPLRPRREFYEKTRNEWEKMREILDSSIKLSLQDETRQGHETEQGEKASRSHCFTNTVGIETGLQLTRRIPEFQVGEDGRSLSGFSTQYHTGNSQQPSGRMSTHTSLSSEPAHLFPTKRDNSNFSKKRNVILKAGEDIGPFNAPRHLARLACFVLGRRACVGWSLEISAELLFGTGNAEKGQGAMTYEVDPSFVEGDEPCITCIRFARNLVHLDDRIGDDAKPEHQERQQVAHSFLKNWFANKQGAVARANKGLQRYADIGIYYLMLTLPNLYADCRQVLEAAKNYRLDNNDNSRLHAAARDGKVAAVRICLENGIRATWKNGSDLTARKAMTQATNGKNDDYREVEAELMRAELRELTAELGAHSSGDARYGAIEKMLESLRKDMAERGLLGDGAETQASTPLVDTSLSSASS